MPFSFYNSIVPWANSYLPFYPNVFLSLWKKKGPETERLSARKQASESSFLYREGSRELVKSRWCSPLITLPTTPIHRLNAPHTCLLLILSWSFFILSTLPLMKSLGFSPLSPGHLALISLSFPLIPNHWHHHPTLCHHPLHPHPHFLYSCSLCSFIFCSAFMASLGPHHRLCSYNGSVVLRWSKTSLICSNWGERSVCPKWKVWVIGYLGKENAISLLSST